MMNTGRQKMHIQPNSKLVVDGSYKTNEGKLVVVCAGPVFLHVGNLDGNDKTDEKVTNRFMPLACVLANRENEAAYAAALQLLLDYGHA
eukprot:1414270-Karenia_brevis.AAC.1